MRKVLRDGRTEPQVQDIQEDSGKAAAQDMKAEGTTVFLKLDKEASTILLSSVEAAEQYSLKYDRTTEFYDRYGAARVAEQFNPGDIVDIVVSVHSELIRSMRLNAEAFEFTGVTDYNININKGMLSLKEGNYRIGQGTVLLKDGRLKAFKDIRGGDTITVRGLGHDAYAVLLESGTGYVRITGSEYFKGGWVEIGSLIKPLSSEMPLSVPEGSYEMKVTYNGQGGTRAITVKRGLETLVDISDMKGELVKYGRISLSFLPEDVIPKVKADGKAVSVLNPIELEYGVHRLEIEAEGYRSLRKSISVGDPMASLVIELEEAVSSNGIKDNEAGAASQNKAGKAALSGNEAPPDTFTRRGTASADSAASSNMAAGQGSSSNAAEPESTGNAVNQLYIDGPEGAEVYFDGSYKGIAPCHFAKSAGAHVVTLMKDGYRTKSYTLTLSTGTENETYSFNELSPEEQYYYDDYANRDG